MGVADPRPTFVGSDNKANCLIAAGESAPTRMRHAMRRYHSFLQRVQAGSARIGKVADAENPSDFLTKWVGKAKFDMSIEYAKNRRNRVDARAMSDDQVHE